MGFQVFQECDVAAAILKKAPVRIKSGKRSPHKTAFIEHENMVIDHMRIPNKHKKEFWAGKASAVADKLKLTSDQYNEFVKCNLKKDAYLKILSEVVKKIKATKNN